MGEIKENLKTRFDFEQEIGRKDQREKDRRKKSCEGYCYISTVGWICRRERFRRKGVVGPH